jgi:hypothetical protein
MWARTGPAVVAKSFLVWILAPRFENVQGVLICSPSILVGYQTKPKDAGDKPVLYASVQTKIPFQWFHRGLPSPKRITMARPIPKSVGAAWLDIYTAALIELDRDKLRMPFEDAERAIAVRSVTLDPVQDADEAQRLADAAHNLSVLRREDR